MAWSIKKVSKKAPIKVSKDSHVKKSVPVKKVVKTASKKKEIKKVIIPKKVSPKLQKKEILKPVKIVKKLESKIKKIAKAETKEKLIEEEIKDLQKNILDATKKDEEAVIVPTGSNSILEDEDNNEEDLENDEKSDNFLNGSNNGNEEIQKYAERTPNEKNIINQPLVEEMEASYLDYAMSVIVARALPDVRDGLKPVHRRILYAMWKLGLRSSGKFRKSATVVGEVLGKYHPHGDTAVYDSLVRMAQDFSLRYPLVNGQGNFGSMDGDGAAAMRYTEAKLHKTAEEMLYDIEKETVDFMPNYDGSQKEPIVLPAKLPNLLLNGSMGIAVGMATNIPPHNLGELVDAICALIDNPDTDTDGLMEFIKGPDFPTGGIAYDIKELRAAYTTGRGGIVVRAKTDIQETKRGFRIIVNEIPYQVNKSVLIEKIASLVKDKKVQGISDLRDESNKEGVRIVIELKDASYPKKVLNALYKHTQLQEKFHFNMVALINGIQPKLMGLKSILEEFIKHRQNVVVRRVTFDLNKAKDRAHILEGLVMALEHIDAIIKTIKQSKDKDVAKINLIKQFKLSDRQAVAILEMRLQQLANLEKIKLEKELEEKMRIIKELTAILGDPKKVLKIIKDELQEMKDKFGDERRTRIIKGEVDQISSEDLIPKEDIVVIMTKDGYIKRMSIDNFHTQNRGGKGVIGSSTREEDIIERLFSCTTHSDLLFFTSRGRAFQLKAYEIPVATRQAKGQNIVNFLQLAPEEKVNTILPNDEMSNFKYLMFVTKNGLIKKTEIDKFSNMRRSGLISIKLKDDDLLRWVKPTSGKDDIMLITSNGQSIRMKEKDIRSMGRSASGVRGIRLKKNDEVVGMIIILDGSSSSDELCVVMANGFGKRTTLKSYKIQGRGGSGVKTAKITTKTGKIVSAFFTNKEIKEKDIIIISIGAQVIRLTVKNIPVIGRDTQGVRLMRFKKNDDIVASVTVV
ncbi:MAG: DNA gyrase subunit A [Patescibacteria group bacterium]|nr:DNA gyrase subunit A [Patescibacteria group bacterium]MDD4304734.1 DNA gyrase subunit A [Patescibacteria group bacterium]MDD4695511.1 DNA gyrase subunit A [Patescibacteria group bacterium]